MVKNSFSLLETILSITVLSILLVSFNTFFTNNKNLNQLSVDLNKVENSFDKKLYDNFELTKNNILIKIDNQENQQIDVDNYVYKNETIKLNKYEK